jgi:CubicO group peptidase (beta-lactamase class C family)
MGRRTASVVGARLTWAAALSVVVGLSACSSAPNEPTVTPAPTAAAAAVCPADDAALADLGATVWSGIKDTFAASDTNQFQDVRAVLVSVCGRPVVAQYLGGSTVASYHTVASVTKSVTSTLVGIALADGSLRSLDQTLADLLPQRRDAMSPAVAAVTLRQLLTMSAGLEADGPNSTVGGWIASKDFVDGILRAGVTGTSGEFAYSSATSHLLAAILVQATGRPVLEYAREKLFAPLGITSQPAEQPLLEEASMGGYDTSGFSWPVDHQGVNFGGGWLRLTPGDMLKLGQLFLDEGRYQGTQVVPAQWVRDATSKQVSTGSGFGGDGYGYQWWVTTAGGEPAYAAVGYGGQLVEVVPSKRLVAVFVTEVLTTTPYARVDGKAYEDIVSYQVLPRLGH